MKCQRSAWSYVDSQYTSSTPTQREKDITVTGRRKGAKEAFARFFEAPSREKLRDLLRDNLGEANEFDFKKEWPETPKLAKHVLGLANYGGGGCIVVGVEQGGNGVLESVGLSSLIDRTEIEKGLYNYLPDTAMRQVEILNFTYEESEYPKLKGNSFQVLLVEDDPEHLPFVAKKDGPGVHSNRIYTRRTAATVEANHDELQRILSRRLETRYSSLRELDLRTHLEQLKVLFEQLTPYNRRFNFGIDWSAAMNAIGEQVPNPNYPQEDYETFVARAIDRKKRRIEMELDI